MLIRVRPLFDSRPMIALVDYDGADLRPLERAFKELGAPAEIVNSIEQLLRASKLVVAVTAPFGVIAAALRDRGVVGALMRAILDGRAFLGIGSGMHLLFDVSYEAGQHTGLGVIPGKSIPFESDAEHLVRRQFKPPHVGWSPVRWSGRCPLLNGLRSGESFYFQHSSHAQPLDTAATVAHSSFGLDFAAVVWEGQVFGTQFLPERSQDAGRTLLANFVAI